MEQRISLNTLAVDYFSWAAAFYENMGKQDAGHYPTLEDPEMINAGLREWLVQPMASR